MRPRGAVGLVVAIAAAVALAARGMWATSQAPAGVTAPGMVYFGGGKTRIGSDAGEPSERPTFEVDIIPFLLDAHPVTIGDFGRFTAATGYRTQAERLGNAGVFEPATGTWSLVDGADWRHPQGPGAPAVPDDHPVTQVSWNDAQAYCAWAGKRLPSEIEWEHAARNGRTGGPQYSWGDALVVAGHFMANTWQGHFPERNTVEDGYLYTSPVGLFGKTPGGLTDMGGNVWQWCTDWYRPYALRDRAFTPGPGSEKVIRGGSFLCDPQVCHGFRVSARGHSTPETGLMHVGFRCARSVGGEDAPRVAYGPQQTR
jgi:sulfatase modifying factor 1